MPVQWILGACLLFGCLQLSTCSGQQRNVRLVGGFNKYEGRVEVFWNDSWGTICDDQWDRRDAWVICKELGFGSPLQIASTAHFGSGPGPILLDNLDCKGTETTILNCSHSGIGVHDCTHFEDAGVACSPPELCLTDPCAHGICVDSGDTFHCICTPGYTGKLCDQVVNCTLPDKAPPGAYFVSPHSSYSYHEVVLVSCTDGPGSTSWTCNEYGQWNSHYIPCASLSGAYRSAANHSYTVIGIGSALVVIGVSVFIFAIVIFIRHKRRHRVESLYEISNLSRLESVQSAYLTMTGGASPMPSPRRSSSVLSTDPLIKASRANMALPPTPTDLVRSPLAHTTSLSVPAADVSKEVENRAEKQIEREIDKRIAKQNEKQIVKPSEKPISKPCEKSASKPTEMPTSPRVATPKQPDAPPKQPDVPPKQPVAPARPKKQNNEQRNKFKFPPPPAPPTTAPSKTLPAVATMSASNGSMMHNDKSRLLSKQKSLDDDRSIVMCADDSTSVRSHYNNEHVADILNKTVKSPFAKI